MVTGQQMEEQAMCLHEIRKENFQTAMYEQHQLGEDIKIEQEKDLSNKDAAKNEALR